MKNSIPRNSSSKRAPRALKGPKRLYTLYTVDRSHRQEESIPFNTFHITTKKTIPIDQTSPRTILIKTHTFHHPFTLLMEKTYHCFSRFTPFPARGFHQTKKTLNPKPFCFHLHIASLALNGSDQALNGSHLTQ